MTRKMPDRERRAMNAKGRRVPRRSRKVPSGQPTMHRGLILFVNTEGAPTFFFAHERPQDAKPAKLPRGYRIAVTSTGYPYVTPPGDQAQIPATPAWWNELGPIGADAARFLSERSHEDRVQGGELLVRLLSGSESAVKLWTRTTGNLVDDRYMIRVYQERLYADMAAGHLPYPEYIRRGDRANQAAFRIEAELERRGTSSAQLRHLRGLLFHLAKGAKP